MAAQPVRQGQAGGQQQDTAKLIAPENCCQADAKASEQRQPDRHRQHGEGHQPGEALRFDQKRRPDPPQAGQEIPEAEQPAEREARAKPLKALAGSGIDRPVQQPDEARKGEEEHKAEVIRRKREGRYGATGCAQQPALPPPCQ